MRKRLVSYIFKKAKIYLAKELKATSDSPRARTLPLKANFWLVLSSLISLPVVSSTDPMLIWTEPKSLAAKILCVDELIFGDKYYDT